jgi:histidinol-phosphatase
MNTLRSMLGFGLDAAWQAGRITLGYFQRQPAVERKSDNSPVTIADREAEQKLRELIGRYYPDHGIIGEEYGRQAGKSSYTWLIDPIDGTKSFVAGVPLYGCLLSLVEGDQAAPVLGVAHFPALNETVYAARGEGCYWNGRRAHVSSVDKLSDATLTMSDIGGWVQYGKAAAWQNLVDSTYIQRTWGDAYGYALVATGRADVMLDGRMEVWDCGPLQVILEEAGGTFTDWQGNATIYGGEAIGTNGALFEQVMKVVKS